METNGTTEKCFRLNFKQNSKGTWYAEWTIRGETIAELELANKQVKDYALDQLKELNGG